MHPETLHLTKKSLLLIVILLILAFAVTAVGILLQKEDPRNEKSMRLVEPPFTEDLKFESWQNDEEKKALLFRRLSSVELKPLSQEERSLILAEYGSGKTTLSEVETKAMIEALNK